MHMNYGDISTPFSEDLGDCHGVPFQISKSCFMPILSGSNRLKQFQSDFTCYKHFCQVQAVYNNANQCDIASIKICPHFFSEDG